MTATPYDTVKAALEEITKKDLCDAAETIHAALSKPRPDIEAVLNERVLGLQYGDTPKGHSYAAGFRACIEALKQKLAEGV